MSMSLGSKHRRHSFEEYKCESRDAICDLCNNNVSFESNEYYCCECKSIFHKDCLTITYPKTHEHTLTFIRRDICIICDVCGMDYTKDMYGCLQCDFFVHRNCIYLPKVIKITRHSHRLFHILFISNGESICGICRTLVDVGFKGYSCLEKTCNYVLHSFCMMRYNVWDGKDLEREPENEVDPEDKLPPFMEINDHRSIRHFSHDHDLTRLDVQGKEENGHVCQSCILPIQFGSFLYCKQCDFALHNACENLSRKMENALHIHPLTIHMDKIENGFFTCSVCNQYSCGFMYKCLQEDCGFKIDSKCASFVEPFNHSVHSHPFYMSPYFDEFIYKCYGCKKPSRFTATCDECVLELEFKCLNLPKLVNYKYDTHPLILYSYTYNSKKLGWWCEICEENIKNSTFFYTCDDCRTTLHVDCLLGKYPYLKSGHRIKMNGLEVEIVSNNGVSRSNCLTCRRICQDKLIFMGRDEVCFCSIKCIQSTK